MILDTGSLQSCSRRAGKTVVTENRLSYVSENRSCIQSKMTIPLIALQLSEWRELSKPNNCHLQCHRFFGSPSLSSVQQMQLVVCSVNKEREQENIMLLDTFFWETNKQKILLF
ncbi:hypothetical protein E2320_001084 [Naja naja]|nr:hypothetical protein E2320_001084 [Naja naja]